jgi:hypothetical protein
MPKRYTSSFILIGLGIVGLISLAACSSTISSETVDQSMKSASQSQEPLAIAIPELISTIPLIPTEAVNPVKQNNEEFSEESFDESYPAPPLLPSEQSDSQDFAYPAPTSDPGFPPSQNEGNPSPESIYPPPPKTHLEATNPSTVNLTSTTPQLVEFFAFW